MGDIKKGLTDLAGLVMLLILVAIVFLPVLVAVGTTALMSPRSMTHGLGWVPVAYLVLVTIVWIPLTQILSAATKVLVIVLTQAQAKPRWFSVVEGLVSWLTLAALLRLTIVESDSAAVLCALLAALGYLVLMPLIERFTENRELAPR